METLLEQRRARLLNRAADLRQEALALLREYNDLAPIARLPAEVLSRIFVFVRDDVDCAESEGVHVVHWCALTLVCRHWTDVAVRTPHLWCVVNFTAQNCQFSHTSLVRAGAVPLYVTVHQVSDLEEMAVLAAIASRMAQVKKLDLFVGQSLNRIINNMALLSTVAAPQLERLSLSHSHSWFLRGIRDEAIKDVFANIFQGHMPQLRTLTLATYGSFWESVLLRCPLLSNLRLSGPITRPELSVNNSENFMEAEVLAGVLTKLPLLEHLALIHALPPGPLADHSKVAQLDRLRSVTFCSEPNRVAYGWQCMHIPRTASMNIEFDEVNLTYTLSELPELSPELEEQICNHIEKWPVESVTFACEVVAEQSRRTSVKTCGSDLGGLQLHLIHISKETDVPYVLDAILPPLEPAFVATETVYLQSASLSPVSPYILSLLPAVQNLHLVGNGACAAIDLLAYDTAGNLNERPSLCLLRTIHINDAHLSDADALLSWLETRRDFGLPVHSLFFVGCTYQWSSETDDAFRESVCAAVENVAWSDWHRHIPAKVVSTNSSSW
jgi:hypothetical protein